MITESLKWTLIGAWLGAIALQPSHAEEQPELADFPSTEQAEAEVLASLTAEALAGLQVTRLAAELSAAAGPQPAKLAALPTPPRPTQSQE